MKWLNDPLLNAEPRFCLVKSCIDVIDVGPCFIKLCVGSRECFIVMN